MKYYVKTLADKKSKDPLQIISSPREPTNFSKQPNTLPGILTTIRVPLQFPECPPTSYNLILGSYTLI